MRAASEELGLDDPTPPKPVLSLFQNLIWQCFCTVSRSRQYTFGPQPLTLAEMRHCFDVFCLPREDQVDAIFLIQELDREWLDQKNETPKASDRAKNGDE